MANTIGRSAGRGHALPLLAGVSSLVAAVLLFGGVGGTGGSRRPLAAGNVFFIPAAAHAAGANGASWRTDVEVHNPGSGTAAFTLQLLRRDADNGSPQSRAYTLGPQQSRRFTDVLVSEFGIDGAAALRVVVGSGSLLVTSRTYNLIGSNPWNLPVGASFGQFVPGCPESEAVPYGEEGRLFQLTQQSAASLDGFRTNLGIVNATASPIDVRVDLYRADGAYLGTKSGGETNLPAYGFRQLNEVFAAWGSVPDGYAVVRTTTPGGAFFAFATVIDNHNSGDPIFIPAERETGDAPPPTPTRTTPPGGSADLAPYQPEGWEAPLVPDASAGSLSTSFLSAHMTTYVRWAVANFGPSNITVPIRYELRIDGARYAGWKTDGGLQAGYYTYVEDFAIPYDTLAPGVHTLSIVADQDNVIPETNESNNSWGKSWEWTAIVFGRGGHASRPAASPRDDADRPTALPRPLRAGARPRGFAPAPLTTSAALYVPASAHASGANGASWRTDLAVHNCGATAATFRIDLLRQATDNGGSVPSRTFSLGPQQSVRYADVLASLFSVDGAASLRVTPLGGEILANSRTYNLIGPNGVGLPVGASFGQFVPGIEEGEAIGYGEEGRIIQLTHRDASSYADFRTNVGYVNATASPIDLRIDLYAASGALLGTIQDGRTHLRAYEFLQINGIFGGYTGWMDDGYAVLRTTTPGGRFFAFATVIDNHSSGDPIFIPATKLSGSTPPPTPTATTTPPGATATPTRTVPPTPTSTPPQPTVTPAVDAIAGIEILNGAMTGLGHSGSGTINIADIANTAKNNGLDAALTQIANSAPQVITKSGNGLVVNYGSGYHAKDGTIYSGSGTITTSSFTVSGSHVIWHGVATPNDIKHDGKPLGTGTGNLTVDYTANGSAVVGDASGTVTSTSNPGSSASGTAHIDTTVCPKYPISGSITATQGGKTTTATFTQACDGSYTLTGTGLTNSGFEVSLKKCDGTYRADYPYFKVAVVETGTTLTKDPACGNKPILGFYNIKVWGKTTSTSVTLYFAFDLGGSGGTALHHYAGTFQGSRSGPGVPVFGTTTYTVSVPQNSCTNAFTESGNSKLIPKAAGCTY